MSRWRKALFDGQAVKRVEHGGALRGNYGVFVSINWRSCAARPSTWWGFDSKEEYAHMVTGLFAAQNKISIF